MSRPAGRLGLDRLEARDRRALVLGAALVVPMLAWMAGVQPYRAALADLDDRIAAERALLARERGLVESEGVLRAAVADARARAGRAERRLLVAANTALAEAELTDYLEVAAVESRVLLEEIRSVASPTRPGVEPGRGGSPAGMEPLGLALRGESDLEGMMTFLRAVETSPLLLRVAALSVEPTADEGRAGSGVLDFTVVLEGLTWSVGSRWEETER